MKMCSFLVGCFLVISPWVVLAGEIEVRIDNPPTNRAVVAWLFDSANTFVNLREPVRVIDLSSGTSDVHRLSGLPEGEYALVVYQDDNENGRLDKNFIGIPREPLGFSNRYWPQGPPSYERAAFRLAEGETKSVDVHLQSVFGEMGLIGVGVGVISSLSPYRDAETLKVQPIPVISYIGDRVQIIGPAAQVGLLNRNKLRMAAVVSYRFGAYDESDSSFLKGMGNRKDTVMAGPSFQAELPAGVSLSADYQHDILGRIDGGVAQIGIDKGFQRGMVTVSPKLALNVLTRNLADYEYGVAEKNATEERPAYRPGNVVYPELGLGCFVELQSDWRIIVSASVAFLPPEISDSPIVETSELFSGFLAVTRLF